jgi:hypothetical protein
MGAPLRRHWNVGAGAPDPATVNVTPVPSQTVWEEGCDVTIGALLTVTTAALLVALPHVFVSTQS